jgi:hypothetical protein
MEGVSVYTCSCGNAVTFQTVQHKLGDPTPVAGGDNFGLTNPTVICAVCLRSRGVELEMRRETFVREGR